MDPVLIDLPPLAELLRLAHQRRGLAPGGPEDLAELSGEDQAAQPALARTAAAFAGGPHKVAVDCAPDLRLRPDVLAAVCVVAREAIDNALAYAFPEGREGRVWVKLAPDEGRFRLTIRDSGVGISDLPPEPPGGAGIIVALARRLGGYARLGSAPFGGGLVTLVFPREPPTDREMRASTVQGQPLSERPHAGL